VRFIRNWGLWIESFSTQYKKSAQTSVEVWFHLGHCESVGCNEQRHGQKGKKKGSLDLITCAIKNRGR